MKMTRLSPRSCPKSCPVLRALSPPGRIPALALALSLAAALAGGAPADAGGDRAPRLPAIRSDNGRVVLERAPDAADRRRRVLDWIRRWRLGMAPVAKAAAVVARTLETEHPSALPPVCRSLGRSLLALERRRLWPAPDYALHLHLHAQIDHLMRAATACLSGRRTAVGAELRRAVRARDQAMLALQRWVGRDVDEEGSR